MERRVPWPPSSPPWGEEEDGWFACVSCRDEDYAVVLVGDGATLAGGDPRERPTIFREAECVEIMQRDESGRGDASLGDFFFFGSAFGSGDAEAWLAFSWIGSAGCLSSGLKRISDEQAEELVMDSRVSVPVAVTVPPLSVTTRHC